MTYVPFLLNHTCNLTLHKKVAVKKLKIVAIACQV